MGVKHETSQTSHVVASETIHQLPRTLKTMEKMTLKVLDDTIYVSHPQ